MTTAALYVRVSTDIQAEEGFSIPAQIKQLQDYCAKNNITVYKVYIDEGISGQKEDRPQFQQMIKDAEKKLFNIILVHKFDRFARKVEISHRIKAQLKKSAVNVISMTEPVEDSPIGFFQEGILELLAEYYVRNLAKETKKGHVERASQGLHNGPIPYGYDSVDHKLVINPEQSKIVKLIFDMYNNKGMSQREISNWLNDNGIPSQLYTRWSHIQIGRILKNIKYIGKIYYDGNIYDGAHDPIISLEEFSAANLHSNERQWKKTYRCESYSKFIFHGLLFCGVCNHIFTLTFNTRKNMNSDDTIKTYYYRCINRNHYDKSKKCINKKNIAAVKIDKKILEYIEQVATGVVSEFTVIEKVDVSEVLSDRKEKINSQLERAKQAYLAGAFTLQEYMEMKSKLENEIQDIEKNKNDTKEKENQNKMRTKISNVWDEFMAAESVIEKKRILSTIVDKIYIYEDHIVVNFVL